MILFISHYAGRTGAPIALLHLVRWLRDNTELRFDILLRRGGELFDDFNDVAPTYVCSHTSKYQIFKSNSASICSDRLPREIRGRKYQLIYSNTVANGSLVSGLFNQDIPLITHCHEMDYWMNKLQQDEMPFTITRTSEFIACSNPSAQCLVKRGVKPNQIQVIPGPFDLSSSVLKASNNLRDELGIAKDSFVVLAGGAEPWRKGKDLFVQLAALLQTIDNQRYDLIWLGDPNDSEFEYWLTASAEYANVTSAIHWPGLVSNPQDYFQISNIFCMLSREDPMPLIAIEAGAFGLPVVCFDSAGGTADWVAESGGGRVVPYLDVGSVANSIRSYAADRDACLADGSLAKSYCRTQFSLSRVGPMVLNVINKYNLDTY